MDGNLRRAKSETRAYQLKERVTRRLQRPLLISVCSQHPRTPLRVETAEALHSNFCLVSKRRPTGRLCFGRLARTTGTSSSDSRSPENDPTHIWPLSPGRSLPIRYRSSKPDLVERSLVPGHRRSSRRCSNAARDDTEPARRLRFRPFRAPVNATAAPPTRTPRTARSRPQAAPEPMSWSVVSLSLQMKSSPDGFQAPLRGAPSE